jgi:uncharacterized protein YcbK (DUF882 family)
MTRLAFIAAIAAAVGLTGAGSAHAQEDYTNRGLSVYAPRPVKSVRGVAAGTQVAAATTLQPSIAPPQVEALRQRAKAALDERLPRRLTVRNANTGESVSVVYWIGGEYDAWELARISQVLHDHHQVETAAIDSRLVDLIWILARFNGSETVNVHSGYRSARTNAQLASASSAVAPDSLHVSGKALDITIPGVSTQALANMALALAWGGVGYYGSLNHVHVDVGAPRSWSNE